MTTSAPNIGDMVSVLIDGVCTSNNALRNLQDVLIQESLAIKEQVTVRD